MTSPRIHALRFRIWQHCEPLGWNTTSAEVAEALGVSSQSVAKVALDAGWTNRLRVARRADGFRAAYLREDFDEALDTDLEIA